MSHEQLKQLKKLSEVFSQGSANPSQIKQLSLLLTEINLHEQKYNISSKNNYGCST
jgi:hypothetical protein